MLHYFRRSTTLLSVKAAKNPPFDGCWLNPIPNHREVQHKLRSDVRCGVLQKGNCGIVRIAEATQREVPGSRPTEVP